LGKTTVKGVGEPVELFEVTGLGPLRTRLQVAARRGLTKFIGRDAEMAQMRRALELTREGHGQVIAAMGEAEVGKSRLFFEFKAVSEGDFLVLEAYSVSHGKASAYLPVIELLRDYFQGGGRLPSRSGFRGAGRTRFASDGVLEFRRSVDLQMPVSESSRVWKKQMGRGTDWRRHEAMPLAEAASGRGDRIS
jgi:hypothetical protein